MGVAAAVVGRKPCGRLVGSQGQFITVNHFILMVGMHFRNLPGRSTAVTRFAGLRNRIRTRPRRLVLIANLILVVWKPTRDIPVILTTIVLVFVPCKRPTLVVVVNGTAGEVMRANVVIWRVKRDSKGHILPWTELWRRQRAAGGQTWRSDMTGRGSSIPRLIPGVCVLLDKDTIRGYSVRPRCLLAVGRPPKGYDWPSNWTRVLPYRSATPVWSPGDVPRGDFALWKHRVSWVHRDTG